MKWLIGLIIIIAVALGVYSYMPETFSTGNAATSTATTTADTMRKYESTELGVSFEYPSTYTVREDNAIKGGREIRYITLVDTEALANAPQNGEGPPSITVGIFSTAATSTDAWLRSDNLSNFQLSNGSTTSASVAGNAAVEYTSDGLYATRNIAILRGERAYVFSVGWINATDTIVTDFEEILSTVRFR